ncbi:MAG: extracellular solute-binding protein [Spirochaetales bacterium]|nr:extracellular solute-binding protein [Spirochaetales bacterium]
MVWLRRLSKLAALLVSIGLLVVGCGEGQARLNVYNWTEYIPEEVLEEFAEEFDVRLVYDNFTSNEEMYAKLKAGGGGYDITFPSQDFVPLMIEEDMLMELDLSRIPNFQLLDPQVQRLNNYDPGFRFSVPYSFGATGIVYWKDRVGTVESSWDAFLHPDVQGKLVLLDDMREVLGAALKRLGYSLNTTDARQIEEARDLVNSWKSGIVKFDNDIISSGFATKEFSMVFSYPENALAEVEETEIEKVGILFPEEGGGLYLDSMVILKDAKNIDLAYNFINFILRPEIYARIMDAFGYPGLVPAANAYRQSEPLYTAEDLPNHEFRLDVGPAIELYNRAWQEVRVGL